MASVFAADIEITGEAFASDDEKAPVFRVDGMAPPDAASKSVASGKRKAS
jgi:hypothetical protein